MSKMTIPTWRKVTPEEIERFSNSIIRAKTVRVNHYTFHHMYGYFFENGFFNKVEYSNNLKAYEVEFDFKNKPKKLAIDEYNAYRKRCRIAADAVINEEITLKEIKQ